MIKRSSTKNRQTKEQRMRVEKKGLMAFEEFKAVEREIKNFKESVEKGRKCLEGESREIIRVETKLKAKKNVPEEEPVVEIEEVLQEAEDCRKRGGLIKECHRKKLLTDCFAIWKELSKKCDEERKEAEEEEKRKKKMDKFLCVLEEALKKSKQANKQQESVKNAAKRTSYSSRYENRFKAQGDMLARQKSLLEDQTKLIERLKNEQKELEIRFKERQSMREIVKGMSAGSKVGARCTEILGECKERRASSTIVEGMRKRWEDVRRRKKEEEEGRRTRKEEEELRKVREEEEKKREEEAERKRKKKMAEEEKVREKLFLGLARSHYKKKLLMKAFSKLKQILRESRDKQRKAEFFYRQSLLRKNLRKFKTFSEQAINNKINFANHYYNKKLLKRYWDGWIAFQEDIIAKCLSADGFYRRKLLSRSFLYWVTFVQHSKLEYEKKCTFADNHYQRTVISKCFAIWAAFPKKMFEVRQKEKRVQMWKEKVREILPDFV